jgi:toxin CcdB
MSQYSIYKNCNDNSKKIYPYLLDVQSSLLNSLETRLVIPLARKDTFEKGIIQNINPIVLVDKIEYIVLTQQMASIHNKSIGKKIDNANINRQDILAAIDFLITGF